jgi:diguanylate cyclase (GGDEF)-like protein/PAS domain S-box-containing protein
MKQPTQRILVVDDDSAGRRLTRATLVKAGFEVAEAANGRLALEQLNQGLPDLVLLDVSMPEIDGFTVCAELRKLPGGTRVPVIMMTGLDDVKSIERAFEVGASDFITKPINWAILSHRVRYILRASNAINELAQSQRRLSNAQRIGDMGDWEWDSRRDRVLCSDQAARIFGHAEAPAAADFAGFFAAVHEDDHGAWQQACRRALSEDHAFAHDLRVRRGDGSLRHLHQQVEVIEHDAAGIPVRLAGAVHDVTRHKTAEAEIRRLAYYDPLTGLPNRLLFTEQLQRALAHCERHGKRLAIMFIDLDNFKRVNDTLGHTCGDELLRTAGDRLAGSLRAYDALTRNAGEGEHAIARLGGDEFIVMVSDIQRPADVGAIAQRLVKTLEQPLVLQGTEVFVGGSVGVAIFPDDGRDIDTLLKNADTAMYRAKEAGRGGFQFYDASMNARALDRLMMETRLRRALERDEFVLHYQPRVDVESGRIVGAEALIRWQHPENGLLPPAEFIPLVEDVGLVIPIGEWAIDVACRQVAAWQGMGLGAIPVAVNLASTHLRERALPALVARAIKDHGLPPQCLELEVTESILLADSAVSGEIADELNRMGVKLSIDDFGTGYSSLSYLKRLPIASLKIDRSFVRDLVTDPDDEAIVTAIIALAHSLKLKVVAEGVESEAQLAMLKARRCDEYQGYLTSRPVDGDEFARVVRKLLADGVNGIGGSVISLPMATTLQHATPAWRSAAA